MIGRIKARIVVKERKCLARRYEIGMFKDETMWRHEERGLKEENEKHFITDI
jgi:hypothetical protein